MPASRTSRLAAFLALAAVLTGCGGDRDEHAAVRLEGPPTHEATRTGLPGNARGMLIRARSPCTLRLSVDGLKTGREPLPARRLAAGESVRLWWDHKVETTALAAEPPTEAQEALGRTRPVGPQILVAYEDRPIQGGGTHWYVRAGAPTQVVHDYVPPVRPEPLAFGAPVELCTFVLADLEGQDARIRPAEPRNRVLPARDEIEAPGQIHVLRLFLRVDPAQ